MTVIDRLLDALPGSVVVYATAAAAGLSAAASEIGQGNDVAEWLVRAAGWLGAAVVAYRRVTPVPAEQRGLR